jgi:putative flippase GtrA
MRQGNSLLTLKQQSLLPRFFYFLAVGVIATLAQYVTLILLVQSHLFGPLPSSVFGFVSGALVSYLLNRRYTFRSNKRHGETVAKFYVICLVGLALNTAIMTVSMNMFELHYLWAQGLATGSVLFWNFAGHLLWTFKE